MNKTDISTKIKVILSEYGLNPKQLTPDASFINDLGLDSLDVAEMFMTMENEFDLAFSYDQVEHPINTVNDLVNFIAQELKVKNDF